MFEHLCKSLTIRSLDGRVFRSNPDIVAIGMDRLPRKQRLVLGDGLYGVLRSQRLGRDVMAIDVDTAVLFLSLKLPRDHSQSPRPRDDALLARLVCEGVLQIQRLDGSFVDGYEASPELFPELDREPPSYQNNAIGQLSQRALRYAALLQHLDSASIAQRLYQYGTYPRTAAWESQPDSRAETMRWLGIRSLAKSLGAEYGIQRAVSKIDPWIRWQRRTSHAHKAPRYKLYVSPQPAQLRDVFHVVVDICCSMRVPSFKIGSGPLGVLRPDKFILYFTKREEIWKVAEQIALQLHGCRVQGVPFSAAIDEAGLLSWGVDPPSEGANSISKGISWRMFIAHHLGNSFGHRSGYNADGLIAFAQQRLRLEGIDPDWWRMREEW